MMSHRLARELPGRIAAIAPIVGAVFGDEPPAPGPVAAIIFVGQDDQTVPAAGGPLGGAQRRGAIGGLAKPPEDHPVAPDVAQADYWARANGCTAPVEAANKTGKIVEIAWNKCSSGRPVHFYRVPENGHAWPGGRAGTRRSRPADPQGERQRDDVAVFCGESQALRRFVSDSRPGNGLRPPFRHKHG